MTLAQEKTIARAYEALETISAAGAELGLNISCSITPQDGLWASISEPGWYMFKQPFLRDLRTKSTAEVRDWEAAILIEIDKVGPQLIAGKKQQLQAELARLSQ
jgi:hypothetical protein